MISENMHVAALNQKFVRKYYHLKYYNVVGIGTTVSSIRLVSSSGSTSSSNTAGRLEVYYIGGWASVCNNGFGASDAHAACRQLGYTTYSRYGTVHSLG